MRRRSPTSPSSPCPSAIKTHANLVERSIQQEIKRRTVEGLGSFPTRPRRTSGHRHPRRNRREMGNHFEKRTSLGTQRMTDQRLRISTHPGLLNPEITRKRIRRVRPKASPSWSASTTISPSNGTTVEDRNRHRILEKTAKLPSKHARKVSGNALSVKGRNTSVSDGRADSSPTAVNMRGRSRFCIRVRQHPIIRRVLR